jgi:hypothetical protein
VLSAALLGALGGKELTAEDAENFRQGHRESPRRFSMKS